MNMKKLIFFVTLWSCLIASAMDNNEDLLLEQIKSRHIIEVEALLENDTIEPTL